MNLSEKVLRAVQEARRSDRYYQEDEPGGEVFLAIPAADRTFEWVLIREGEDLPQNIQVSGAISGMGEPGRSYLVMRSNRDGRLMAHLFAQIEGGIVKQLRGYANDVPSPKYHPQIVELLKHPSIKGIGLTGYSPGGNFKMSDLSPEQVEDIKRANPGFREIEPEPDEWDEY